MRVIYLPKLLNLYKMAQAMCSQAPNVEQLEIYKHARCMIERMIKYLQIPDIDILCYSKNKLIHHQNLIIQYVSSFGGKNPLTSGSVEHQFPPPSGCSHSTQLQNLLSQSLNSTPMTKPAGPLVSLWQGVSSSQHITLKQGPPKLGPGTKKQIPQAIIQPRKSQMLLQKKDEINDSILRQMTDNTTGIMQHVCSRGQYSEDFISLLLPLPHEFHDSSTQTSQNYSLHINPKNTLSPPSEAEASLQPTKSVCFAHSPSTPLILSSMPIDLGKCTRDMLTASFADKTGDTEAFVAASASKVLGQNVVEDQSVSIGTPGISASSGPDKNQLSVSIKQPLEHLIEVIQSATYEAVIASIHEMFSVFRVQGTLSETSCVDDYEVNIDGDSTTIASCSVKGDGRASAKKLKRCINSMALDALTPFENAGFMQLSVSDGISRIKRPRIEPNEELLEEIRTTNCRFVETAIDVVSDSDEDAAATGAGEGTIVRCTYTAVAVGENFRRHFSASPMFPLLSIELLVPSNYPDSPPKILERSPVVFGEEETEDLTEKAKCRFSRSLRSLPESVSLGDLACVWDQSARSVFSDLTHVIGGGCFSSKFGTWERISAA